MLIINRRRTLGLGAGLLAASALPARAAITAASVRAAQDGSREGRRAARPPPLEIRRRRLQAVFDENTKRFSDKTGIAVKVDYLAWDNMPAQTAVVANTGAGPDIVVGFGPDPQIFSTKLIELTDIAEYLGKKYGGWFQLAELYGKKWKSADWIGIPMGGTAGPAVYRTAWVKEAGFDKIPMELDKFLDLCKGLKKIGHPCGFALGHALGDANGYANFLLWAHGGRLVDEDGKPSPSTARKPAPRSTTPAPCRRP